MKNETKHTPGPWGESYVTEINHHAKSIISTPRGDLITEQNLGLGWDERAANVHLIAASPELLEACKNAIIAIDNHIAQNPMAKTILPDVRANLQKVVKKAEE